MLVFASACTPAVAQQISKPATPPVDDKAGAAPAKAANTGVRFVLQNESASSKLPSKLFVIGDKPEPAEMSISFPYPSVRLMLPETRKIAFFDSKPQLGKDGKWEPAPIAVATVPPDVARTLAIVAFNQENKMQFRCLDESKIPAGTVLVMNELNREIGIELRKDTPPHFQEKPSPSIEIKPGASFLFNEAATGVKMGTAVGVRIYHKMKIKDVIKWVVFNQTTIGSMTDRTILLQISPHGASGMQSMMNKIILFKESTPSTPAAAPAKPK